MRIKNCSVTSELGLTLRLCSSFYRGTSTRRLFFIPKILCFASSTLNFNFFQKPLWNPSRTPHFVGHGPRNHENRFNSGGDSTLQLQLLLSAPTATAVTAVTAAVTAATTAATAATATTAIPAATAATAATAAAAADTADTVAPDVTG